MVRTLFFFRASFSPRQTLLELDAQFQRLQLLAQLVVLRA
jgi:hypothetical protein